MFLDNQMKKDCCGCMACSKVCGFSAIEMQKDECGFYYPKVNKELCRDCGMCESVCPMMENYVGQDAEPDTYAVKNKDTEILKRSSSGGMFSLLADWIIGQGGVVYGVMFDENYSVRHSRAISMEEVSRFCTSKYVESDISEVYGAVVQDLKEDKVVLLTGTPCQISALKKYLAVKKINTDKLYTCDNICHGVPSREVWEEYLDILRDNYIAADDEIVSINMRSKRVSWKEQVMDVKLKKGNIDDILQTFSFNKLFLSLFANRSSCFNCRYTSYKRPGDFSLGDFWNVENAGISFDVEGGVNVVLVNTPKGKNVFEQLKGCVDWQAVTKEKCWQPHLEYSAKKPEKQDEFWRNYRIAVDKEELFRKYMKGSILTRVIRKVTPFLRKTGLYGAAGKLYKTVLVEKKK